MIVLITRLVEAGLHNLKSWTIVQKRYVKSYWCPVMDFEDCEVETESFF